MKVRLLVLCGLLLTAACEPRDRTPGTWTRGEIVEGPVADWSFTDDALEVFLQTHPWYGVPHSVTTVLASANDTLYIPSIYFDPEAPFPEGKYWNRIVAENPEVLLKVGGKRYPLKISHITDEAEFEKGFLALAAKYPFWQEQYENEAERVTFHLFRLDPR